MIENWETASSNCALQGGRLFNPFKQIPSYTGGEYYWTEIHRIANTDFFQTTNGNNISVIYYWKYKHPIDSIDCVGYYQEGGELLSLECNTTHLVVCRIGRYKYNSSFVVYKYASFVFVTLCPLTVPIIKCCTLICLHRLY